MVPIVMLKIALQSLICLIGCLFVLKFTENLLCYCETLVWLTFKNLLKIQSKLFFTFCDVFTEQ